MQHNEKLISTLIFTALILSMGMAVYGMARYGVAGVFLVFPRFSWDGIFLVSAAFLLITRTQIIPKQFESRGLSDRRSDVGLFGSSCSYFFFYLPLIVFQLISSHISSLP